MANALFRRDTRDSPYSKIVQSIDDTKKKTDEMQDQMQEAARIARPRASELGKDLMDMLMKESNVAKEALNKGLDNAQNMASDLNQRAGAVSDISGNMGIWDVVQMQYGTQALEFMSQAKRFNEVLNKNGFSI